MTFAMTPGEEHLNPLGTVHGGLLATMLDSAMGCAVQSVLPAGHVYTTVQLDVKYVRSPPLGRGRILAEGTVVHAGRRTATAEGRVLDARRAAVRARDDDLPGARGLEASGRVHYAATAGSSFSGRSSSAYDTEWRASSPPGLTS